MGAEYFCIDSGWYAELDEGWWDTVGRLEAVARPGFPAASPRCSATSGRRAWCPACGWSRRSSACAARSPRNLPPEAFFQRDGQRVVENGRYHLDLRHPAAVKHLDEVVDFVVGDLGSAT